MRESNPRHLGLLIRPKGHNHYAKTPVAGIVLIQTPIQSKREKVLHIRGGGGKGGGGEPGAIFLGVWPYYKSRTSEFRVRD